MGPLLSCRPTARRLRTGNGSVLGCWDRSSRPGTMPSATGRKAGPPCSLIRARLPSGWHLPG
eukprot:11066851-Alexandrium_andersonii.AAC.1